MSLLDEMRARYGMRPSVAAMREESRRSDLRKTLGWKQLTALGVGAIVGAGVFSVIGVAAAETGPAVAISFIVAALVALLAALAYAELAAMLPVAGSAYTYGYVAGGELFAWLIGWALILSYGIGNAALASSFSDNLTGLLGRTFNWDVPVAFTATPGVDAATGSATLFDVPALLIVLLITFLLLRPVRESALVNALLVVLKLGVLALFLVVALPRGDAANLTPFAPFGLPSILSGAALIFFAYLGFDAISTAAEETRDPQRDLPRGIIGSLVITTALFVTLAIALTAVARYDTLGTGEPLAIALDAAGFPGLGAVMNIGGLVAALSVLLVFQLATVRVVLALCRDGLLPPWLATVSREHATPNRLTLILGITVAVFSAVVPLGLLVIVTNLAALFIFGGVMLALLLLRRHSPDAPRAFRCPAVPLLPMIGIAATLGLAILAILVEPVTGIGFVGWMGLGMMVYAAYGARNSALRARAHARAGEDDGADAPAPGDT